MPVDIVYLDDGYGIELIGKGVVTGEEIQACNRVIYSGDTLVRQRYQLINLTDVEAFVVSNADVTDLANQDIEASKTNPDIIIAVVAKDKLAFGLARMWEAHADKATFETMVFRERPEALAWIKQKLDEPKGV